MRRSVLGLGSACLAGVGITVAVAASSAATGCTTHQCDTDFVDIDQSTGTSVGELQVLSPGVALWESSPVDGPLIDFPGQRTYLFTLPPGFQPLSPPLPYVATDPNAGTSVVAAGQLAQIAPYAAAQPGQTSFNITNATCAEYYLYVSILGTVPPADAGTGD